MIQEGTKTTENDNNSKIAKHDTIRYYVKCKKERSKIRQDLNQFAANLVELLHFSALQQCIKFA